MKLQLLTCAAIIFVTALAAHGGENQSNLLVNGSFELWSHHGAERLQDMLKNGPAFESDDPLIPTRWTWRMNKPMGFKRSADARGGKHSISIWSPAGGGGHLSMGKLEVVPGAKYSFGVWAKGSGNVTVDIVGEAPEGTQELGKAAGKASDKWELVAGSVEIPEHIRLVWLRIWPGSPCEMVLDDAHISAPLDKPFDVDEALTQKYQHDEHTMLLLDFEKDDPDLKVEGKVQITKADGGRFGRGLSINGAGTAGVMASMPFKLNAMPEEGTIEFWLSVDEMPMLNPGSWQKQNMYLQILGPSNQLLSVMAGTDNTVSARWRIDNDVYGKSNLLQSSNEISAMRMRKGEWHHVAVTWDKSAWRLYFDGVLSAITTTPPLTWWDSPVLITMGSEYEHLGWNGLIDEIRVSKIKRFGPVTPKGATAKPLPVPEPPAVVKQQSADKPKADFTEERKQIISGIEPTQPGAHEIVPDSRGRLVYEATSAKPLVEGLDFKLEQDNIVKGLTTASVQRFRLLGLPNMGGMYWRLGGIKPARYWIGLVHQTGEGVGNMEAMDGNGNFDVYLNGRQVHFASKSDPVQIAPGHWFAEAQSAFSESLKEGDEIAIVGNYGSRVRAARLVLHSEEPRRGAHRMRINPGQNTFNQDTSLGLSAETTFMPASGKKIFSNMYDSYYGPEQWIESTDDLLRDADGKAIAHCLLFNPLPVPIEVDYDCVVKGYYLQVAGRDTARLTLAPHSCTTRNVRFEPTLDDPSYAMTTTVKAVKRHDLGWPAYDELTFFPGLRHLVPWTDPMSYKFHRRLSIKQVMKAPRQRMALHGLWENAFTRDLKPAVPAPADLKFAPTLAPPQWGRLANFNDPMSNAVYLRRKFVLSEGDLHGVAKIIVDSVSSEGTLYINGKMVGSVRGHGTPLVGDATEALRPGENEILLVIRNKLAITNPEYVNVKSPTESTQYMDAPGDCNASLSMSGGIWLELMPKIASHDVKVDTSVRKGTVGARFAIVNAGKQDSRLKVKASVEDARNPVLSLGERELTLKAGESKDVDFVKEWKDARLWNWREPNLYVMAVEIIDAATGKRLDLARERFGFRETWIQGDQILVNGLPVRFQGVGTAPSISMRCAVQLGRGSQCPDYNDETGDPITVLVTGLVNTPSKYNVSSDLFWKTTQDNALLAIKRKWNHASIIAWDLSNEWYTYAPYTGADMALAGKRFMGLSDAVEKLDPSRWTFFNGDYDIGGAHYMVSSHYMLEGAGRRSTGFDFAGHSSYFPDGAFLKPFDKELKPGDEIIISIHGQKPYKVGSKPLTDTENQWKVGSYMPPGSCKFMGEDNVLSPALESSAGAIVWMWKQNFDGHRDLNMAIHSNHEEMPGTINRGQLLQTFIMPDVVHHGFAGRTIVRGYSILNDLFRPALMSFKWRMVGPGGKVLAEGADERKMDQGSTSRASLSLTLPQVTQRTSYTLELRLYSEGQFVCGEDRDINVWPDSQIAAGQVTRKVTLFDPKGDTAKVLQAAGVQFELLANLAPPSGDASKNVLIIGEGALNENTAKQAVALSPFVEDGGRVLVLSQSVLAQGLPVITALEIREWVSQPYVRMPIHPLLHGVTSWDLHFWAPDRVSARGAYSKPHGGAAVPLVDSGAENGLEWVQVMEMYRGKGLYLLCQMPLVASFNEEPMARELLAKAMNYMGASESFLSPTRRLRLMGAKDGPTGKNLQELGIDFDVVAPDAGLHPTNPTLMEAGTIPDAAMLASWKKSLTGGSRLLVSGASPDDAPWLSELAESSVRLTVPRYRMWEGRGYRSEFHPLTAGLTHLDLFWKQYVWNSNITENADYVIEQFQDWSIDAASGKELIFPGALVEITTGQGRLIIDQRRWATSNQKLTKLAARNLSSLSLGLGVGITPPPPPREWPSNLAYRPIDLTPFANRSLMDETAEDGKGGWSDQGPNADLRSFPTGDKTFRGVPFKIGSGDKSVIVLKSQARPQNINTPNEVIIPVGHLVEGLCFLHSSAYTGDSVGMYQIHFADGTTVDIPLQGSVNISDWAAVSPAEFPNERGTKSRIAWTGSCKLFSPITVLMMQWVNPKPEVPVKAVRFANPEERSFPILIGLTAAIQRDANEAARNMAKAQDLYKQAQQAVQASKVAQAKVLLKRATAMSPDLAVAHQMLADLCEKDGNEDELLDAYRHWTQTNPQTPLPWNRLGQMLEKRKDFKGALEAYTESLKVEWNQPPTIEGKTRMEKKLSE